MKANTHQYLKITVLPVMFIATVIYLLFLSPIVGEKQATTSKPKEDLINEQKKLVTLSASKEISQVYTEVSFSANSKSVDLQKNDRPSTLLLGAIIVISFLFSLFLLIKIIISEANILQGGTYTIDLRNKRSKTNELQNSRASIKL